MADTPTPQSTVRKRKGNSTSASTQRFLPIAEIRNDTVILKNGGMRAVLEVEALNFNLKSETEQKGIIAGYGSFVNTLLFPLQIVMRSSRTNIDDYLVNIRDMASKQENALLKQQTEAYANFMEKLIDVADIMQKKFYVVVPIDQSPGKKGVLDQFFGWFSSDDTSAKASSRNKAFARGSKQLQERVEVVSSGLSNVGLHVKRLNTRELVNLYYNVFNPDTSQHQKLPENLDDLEEEKTVL